MLYNAVGIYVLAVSLLSIFVIVLLARQGRTHKDVSLWLVSGLVGILLGAAAAGAVVQALGYELAKKHVPPQGVTLASMSQDGQMPGVPMGMESGQQGMGTSGLSCGSHGGSHEGSSCGASTSASTGSSCGSSGDQASGTVAPRVQLTMLVHKINLLTSDIALRLTDAQAAGLVKILTQIKAQQGISNEEAIVLQKQILDQLDVAQKSKPASIGLPPSTASGAQNVQGQSANPFEPQQNAQALQALLDRLSKPATPKPVAAVAR